MTQERRNTTARRGQKTPDSTAAQMLDGRVPPQAIDLEKAVLGAMMMDQDCLAQAMGSLNDRCFYDPRAREVYHAVASLYGANRPVDMLSVAEQMKLQGTFASAGGAVFLADLTSSVGSALHLEYHLLILQQKAIQRNLIEASCSILRDAFDETVEVGTLIDDATRKVYDAVQANMTTSFKHVGEVADRAMEKISRTQAEGTMPGVPSGFPELDALTSGWQPGNLVVVGARPSMGKTAFALNMARAASVRFGVPTAFFTLEMPDTEIADRLLTSVSGVPSAKIKGKGGEKLSGEEWTRLEQALGTLSSAPLYIDETPALPISEFVTKARKLRHDHGIGLIIIDYLQLMKGSASTAGYREQEVSSISRTLKATAKDLGIPIVALSQLNRNISARAGANGRPMLSDLRESGAIEQDADIVLFVHRPALLGLSDDESHTEILVEKNRSGKTGEIALHYNGDLFQFEDAMTLTQMYESRMNTDAQEVGYDPSDFMYGDFH